MKTGERKTDKIEDVISNGLRVWCHAKPTMDGVKFVNLTCWKIEENHTVDVV